MNSYTPLFSKIVDSSVWGEPDHVRIVFITMLALKDPDHIVRYSAYQLGQRAKKSEAQVLDALKILSSPDTKRLEPQPFEGRRIQKVPEGWLMLNGPTYQSMMTELNRRAYKTKKQREYRLRDSAPRGTLPGETAAVRAEENGATQQQVDSITSEALNARLEDE